MTVAQQPAPTATDAAEGGPRRFTVDEYYLMAEVGIIKPGERVELLEGKIIQMSPIGPMHAAAVKDVKLPLYAAAGIPEVWIVDLASQQIEQHYGPGGNQYRSKQTWSRGQDVPAQTIAGLVVAVDAVLG